MSKTRVAVAGGSGFLGSHVVNVLEGHGYNVIPFSRRTGVDIRNYRSLTLFLDNEKPDVVINCAANAGGISYNREEPVQIYEDNLMIGANLNRWCARKGVRKLVHAVPNCVYPGSATWYKEDELWDGPMHDSVIVTAAPRRATMIHSLALRQQYRFNSIHLILPNMYGPGDHFDPVMSHAMGALIRKIVDASRNGNDSVVIWGTGVPQREWGYVEDIAKGIVLAMQKYDGGEGGPADSIMNIGCGEAYSISGIAHMIKAEVGWDGKFRYDTSKPNGVLAKALVVGKMLEVLEWMPPTSIEDGIRKTVEWYTERKDQDND